MSSGRDWVTFGISRMRSWTAILVVFFCTFATAQIPQPKPSTPEPQPPIQTPERSGERRTPAGNTGQSSQPQPLPAPEAQRTPPEHKISAEEADELFRSVDEILQFASKVTGLPIKHKVERKLASRDEVEHYVEQRMKEDPDAERLDRASVVLKKFGLLPRDFELRPFLLTLLKEQVAGFYDTRTKTVYLLDWLDPVAQKPVLAHELTHALQDQNFELEQWTEVSKKKLSVDEEIARDEARTARQGIVEGQAMIVLIDYVLAPLGRSVSDSPQMVDMMKAEMLSEGSTPAFALAPAYLREGLTFPYSYGMDFVRMVLASKGQRGAFAGVFRNPPVDTRQVMQPETYLNSERVKPLKLAPLDKVVGEEYTRFDVGGLGEFDVHIISKVWGGRSDAEKIAPGWRGGYYMAFRKKGQPEAPVQLAAVLRFETPRLAEAFSQAYRNGLTKRYKSVKNVDGGGSMTEEGLAVAQVAGDLVAITEGFSPELAGKIRGSMFESAK